VSRRPLIIAHRGFSGRFPENTLAAVRGALAVPVDMVEVDVQQTADQKIVVFHDDLLRRLCGIPGRISQVTWKQLRHAKPDVPTLAQTLRAVRGRAHLLIEIKSADPRQVAQEIDRAGMIDQVIVFAFETRLLEILAAANPRICRYGLVATDLDRSLRPLKGLVAGIGVDNRLLESAADVRRLGKRVGPVFVWTVNRAGRMRELASWGVDGLITNRPDVARDSLDVGLSEPRLTRSRRF
jgi:glycerophosphoryl diester phosphodiesterase